ncbi:MAG: amino acid adenylation domain-containing protein [Nitriliruptorales bacterium]|nr:amino acid adenylation domain-containing protein [Nitriliruptorales bacterium]
MNYLVHHLLESSVAADPDRLAVADGGRSRTYGELESRANQFANLLLSLGLQRGDRVGLYLEKSFEAVAAIYGTMKAGGAYVPLDPQAPPKRLSYVASNCGVRHLVAGSERLAVARSILADCPPPREVIVTGQCELAPGGGHVSYHGLDELDGQSTEPPAVHVIDDDLAYILYTSGSTGQPKGVMLTHRNARTFIDWARDEFELHPEDRLSSHAPFHFDLSVFDLFAAAAAGAAVVLVPRRTSVFPISVARFMKDQKISVWYSVPSILTMLTMAGGLDTVRLPHLRAVLFAGEVFPTKHLRKLRQLLPDVRLANLYGPTETNVCTWYEVKELPGDDATTIPIGRAIANVDTFVVTDDGERASPGQVGELHVRGGTLMKGYWADPDRTAQSLVADPFGGDFPDPVYRTGDLVRERTDGNYDFLGRRDAQIKSRGYRIELGEIENALHAHPDVAESVVVAVPDELVTNRILAFVVRRGQEVDEKELVAFCRERIPRYMIPERFEFREALDKTSTGKVARQTLRTEALRLSRANP